MYVEDYGPDRTRELGPEPTLHDPVAIAESELGAWTEIRQHPRLNESAIGDYTYLMERVQANGGLAAYLLVGTDHPTDHHTPTFDVDERSLAIGVDVLSRAVLAAFDR